MKKEFIIERIGNGFLCDDDHCYSPTIQLIFDKTVEQMLQNQEVPIGGKIKVIIELKSNDNEWNFKSR